MKRVLLSGFIVCGAALTLAPVAVASTTARHVAPHRVRHTTLASRSHARLGADPTYAISGHALNYDGTGARGAVVDWGWWDADGYFNLGSTAALTDGFGAFALSAVTSNASAVADSDDLTVYPLNSPIVKLESWANDFSANNNASAFSYGLQPGQVHVAFTGLSAAQAGAMSDISVAGSPGLGETAAQLTNGEGDAYAMPATFNDVVGGFINSRGAMTAATQWQGPDSAVSAGQPSAASVTLDWSKVHQAYIYGPACRHSGKPGSVVKLVLKGWPAGEEADISLQGYSQSWDFTPQFNSTGAERVVSLRIPTTAVVDWYQLHASRIDSGDLNGLPDLWDVFQVCTFKPSVSSVLHGHAVRLSGKVPAGAGSVTIYSTPHKVSGQPGALAAKGWHRVGSYKISSRKFASGLLHPTRTTWYVAKYTGYAFQAFTSVIKVTVR